MFYHLFNKFGLINRINNLTRNILFVYENTPIQIIIFSKLIALHYSSIFLFTPVIFNRDTNKVKLIRGKKLVLYKLITILMLLVRILQYSLGFNELEALPLSHPRNSFRILRWLLMILTGYYSLRTFLHTNELIHIINLSPFIKNHEIFASLISKKSTRFQGIIFTILTFSLIGWSYGLVIGGLTFCGYNFVEDIFGICNTTQQSFFTTLYETLVNLIVCTELVSSLIPTCVYWVEATLTLHTILKQMLYMERKKLNVPTEVDEHLRWLIRYRVLQIVGNKMTVFNGSISFPFGICFIIISSTTTFCLVVINFYMMKPIIILITFVYVMFIVLGGILALDTFSKITMASTQLMKLHKQRCHKLYQFKQLKSLTQIRIPIGSFYYASTQVTGLVVLAITNSTMSSLIYLRQH